MADDSVSQGAGRSLKMRTHAACALLFCALALISSFPLALNVSTHMPGMGVGDNAMFLWNFWWMRAVLESGGSFFFTSYLFAPTGVDLTLHTHAALPALVGATALGSVPLLVALNVTTLIGLALNGFTAYLLAWRVTRDRWAALLAGVIFALSPYVAAHLQGHYNLIHAWTIPLYLLAYLETLRGSIKSGVLAGVALAAIVYVDYYYAIFAVALSFVILVLAVWDFSVERGKGKKHQQWALGLVVGLIALDAAVILLIAMTGGISGELGPIRFSARETFNLRQVLWLLVAAGLWIRFRPRVRVGPATRRPGPAMRGVLTALGTSIVLSSPILWNGIRLVLAESYVTQQYFWRSAPAGVDIATMVLGNPFHGLVGSSVRNLYSRMGIDFIESSAWLGALPVVLCFYVVKRHWDDAAVRMWAIVSGLFFIWAIGSHTLIAGQNTGMIMPATLLRFVPFVANARVPGRAMVVVYLAMAVLAAIGLSAYRRHSARPALVAALAACITLAEFFPAPYPLARVECTPIYEILRLRPERGSVAELPLGLGDGFGALTRVDHRVLTCQPVHGRPLIGGVIARLTPDVMAVYRSDPLLATWIRLSEPTSGTIGPGAQADAAVSRERLHTNGIDFVVLNRVVASAELRRHVEDVLPLDELASDDERTLYLVRTER